MPFCANADGFLVEDGQARAEIVIGDAPTRMQRVAAHEFRDNLLKISGAKLPIVAQPSGKAVKVFVGASAHCPLKTEGLEYGAYRIAAGPDWLALIGDDSDFSPTEPFAQNNGDIARAQAEWEKIAGAPYGMPATGLYKNRLKLTLDGEPLTIWGLDERGSFNAVTAFFHRLGARWYLPGELGEVMPSMKTIPLPQIDETVRPDFPLRQFNFRFGVVGEDTARWMMRLGTRNDERYQIAHGMDNMTGNDATFAAHPEWFALYGGKRDYTPGYSKNQLCYSDEGLLRETVRWARAQLDTYHFKTVSIMPPDGYTSICQCEKCRGKDSPDRNERGLLSDYVWDFVNRVAREIAKSHPEAKVLNCAYGVYTLPPLNIDKLESNVVVCIVGGRRPINKGGVKGEGESAPDLLRAGWAKKTAHPLLIFENYPFTDRGWYLPSFAPHALGDSVNATKGISQGEDIWLSVRQDFAEVGIGFNHFMVYFTARMYWGGKEADVEAMFREYCRLFYGPAEAEMLAFFTYCEANWATMDEDKAKADEALALFDKAKARADAASVYGKRIGLIDDFLKGLRMKSIQMGQKRGPVPTVRLVGDAKGIVIDGKLDDEYWNHCPVAASGAFRELQTGGQPIFGTTYRAGWQGDSLYFAIRCEERRGEPPFNASTRDDDPAIWKGDALEIELATETHSYYQIAISPAGHVVDLDRGAPRSQWFGWDSKAEVATQVADDHWIAEIRIPVTVDENDPLHQVVGRKPIQSLPWHINLCRQKIRDDGTELSALSPTGRDGFHAPMKFAHFFGGNSHAFEADPTVTDFAIGFPAAVRERKAAAFLSLAEGENVTDFQKSIALEQAAFYDKANAEPLIALIPIEAVKKAADMQHLLATQQAPELIARFGGEDFSKWPFWKRGDGLQLRGRAYAITKAADEAEADLSAALEWTSETRKRQSIHLALGNHREMTRKDDAAALSAYGEVYGSAKQIGGADEFDAVQATARILTRQGKFAEALTALDRIDTSKVKGTWLHSTLIARGDTLLAAGREAEARTVFEAVIGDSEAEKRHRDAAAARLKSLN